MKKKLCLVLTLFLVFAVQTAFSQQKTVSGTVFEAEGPLPGANVLVKGTSNGTQTDFDGKFSLPNVNATDIIVVSYVGFKNVEIPIGSQTSITITLEADNTLDEIVIIGFGSRTKELSTSAISTVTGKDIENLVPSTSLDNALQGKAAGVQVVGANGRPGQTAFVQIRGIGSLSASTTPLYVVDGVPIDANDVNNINPNDIESFSILKDAATVSLYGSRGANGVVLIATKKGKNGEAKINFNSSIGFSQRTPDPFNLLDARGKLDIERQFAELGVAAAQSLPGATSTPEELANLIALDTNWEEELLRQGFIQNNSLSISGGDEKLSYFLSLAYSKNTGIIDRIDGFERTSIRLNTSYQAKKWLKLTTNISLSRNTSDLPRDRNNVQNPFRGLYDYNPYEPLFLRNEDGSIATDDNGENVFNPTSTGFPIARALQTEPEDNRNFLIIGSLGADIKLSNKFSNNFLVGATSNRFNRTNRSLPGGVLQGFIGDANFPGTQTDNASIDLRYNVTNTLSYEDTFNGVHNIQADFLLEYIERVFTSQFSTSRGFPSPDIPFQDVATEAQTAGSDESRNRLFSQGLFLTYDYDRKYVASGSIRRDTSTRFGPNNQEGYFWSGSVAWNISNESFLADNGTISNLKLRASLGTAGNQAIGNFQFLNLAGFSTFNGNAALIPFGLGNPNIQWEAQRTLDIGVEWGLFNNRLNGVVDFFQRNSDELLLPRPLSLTQGDLDNSVTTNVGEIENQGLEISLNYDIIRNSDFRFSTGGNISFQLNNKVISLLDGADIINGNTILREGEELNTFFLPRYAGVNPANGAPLYLDQNDAITDNFSADFQTLLEGKSPAPDIQGGFYTNLSWKGFSLRSDWAFQAGNYIINFQRQAGVAIGNIDSNLRTEALNFWKQPGDTDVLPSPLFQATADQTSTRFLEKGDFLRLRSLTLAYNLPSTFTEKLFISSLRIYGTGQNILTVTGFEGDPEVGIGSAETSEPGDAGFVAGAFNLFSYPQTRSYTFGVEIGF